MGSYHTFFCTWINAPLAQSGAAPSMRSLSDSQGVDVLQIRLGKTQITPVWVRCAAEHGVWRACSWPWGRKKRRFRTIPGVTKQFKLLLRRAGVKWVRGWSYKFIDMLLFVGAALVVGEPHAGPA